MFKSISFRHEVMMALLNLIQERYGGVESYLMKHANMSKNDLESIRQNFSGFHVEKLNYIVFRFISSATGSKP